MSQPLPPGLTGPTTTKAPALRATAAWAQLVKAVHRDLPDSLRRSALIRRRIRAASHSTRKG